MAANKPLPPVTAKPWAIDAACATPAGIALIDLLADHPSTWDNPHVQKRIHTLCNECPVKPQCRQLGQANARPNSKRWFRLTNSIPYAGHPLKHYRQETAA